MRKIAFYDMDKTITRAPTWTLFLVHAARMRAPWRLLLLPVAGLMTLGYVAGLLDRGGLKVATQRLMLGRALPPAEMARVADAFADRVVHTGVFEGAVDRIAADRQAGYTLVLATASHSYYAHAIAQRLGFDDIVATAARRDGAGNVLSRIEGENCYGPAKLRMVEHWLARQGVARGAVHVRAYSDHVSDVPLLEWADEAFAVNPHGALRTMAAERGWPVLDWHG